MRYVEATVEMKEQTTRNRNLWHARKARVSHIVRAICIIRERSDRYPLGGVMLGNKTCFNDYFNRAVTGNAWSYRCMKVKWIAHCDEPITIDSAITEKSVLNYLNRLWCKIPGVIRNTIIRTISYSRRTRNKLRCYFSFYAICKQYFFSS